MKTSEPDKLTVDEIEYLQTVDRNLKHTQVTSGELLDQLSWIMRKNEYMKMRLSQIASGDYKACGLFAEDVAKDGLNWNKDSCSCKAFKEEIGLSADQKLVCTVCDNQTKT